MMKIVLHIALRLGFALCLFLSQFTSTRTTFLSENEYLLVAGFLLAFAGIVLFIMASAKLTGAMKERKLTVKGPYRFVRHPIYLSIYILSSGLGLIFFAWLWFVVLAAFLPLWLLECRNEEKELITSFGKEYEEYKEHTGMIIPRLFS